MLRVTRPNLSRSFTRSRVLSPAALHHRSFQTPVITKVGSTQLRDVRCLLGSRLRDCSETCVLTSPPSNTCSLFRCGTSAPIIRRYSVFACRGARSDHLPPLKK